MNHFKTLTSHCRDNNLLSSLKERLGLAIYVLKKVLCQDVLSGAYMIEVTRYWWNKYETFTNKETVSLNVP